MTDDKLFVFGDMIDVTVAWNLWDPPKPPQTNRDHKPVQAYCRNCEKLFCYFQYNLKRRKFCSRFCAREMNKLECNSRAKIRRWAQKHRILTQEVGEDMTEYIHVRLNDRHFLVDFDNTDRACRIKERKAKSDLRGVYDVVYWQRGRHILGNSNAMPKRIIAVAQAKRRANYDRRSQA